MFKCAAAFWSRWTFFDDWSQRVYNFEIQILNQLNPGTSLSVSLTANSSQCARLFFHSLAIERQRYIRLRFVAAGGNVWRQDISLRVAATASICQRCWTSCSRYTVVFTLCLCQFSEFVDLIKDLATLHSNTGLHQFNKGSGGYVNQRHYTWTATAGINTELCQLVETDAQKM